MSLLFIDFEASSLNPSSYPIEVAWSNEDGSIESHLIKPDSVKTWTDWDGYAESEIHHISREMLTKEGKSPLWVANRMNEVLADKVLLSNCDKLDFDWCCDIFKAADEYMYFQIGSSADKFAHALDLTGQALDKKLEQIKQQAWQGLEGQHRASVDVQQLMTMWQIINLEKELN